MIKAYEAIKEEYEAHAVYEDLLVQYQHVLETEILLRKKFISRHAKMLNLLPTSAIEHPELLEFVNLELENFKAKEKAKEQRKHLKRKKQSDTRRKK